MQALLDSLNLTYQRISIDGKALRGAKTGLHFDNDITKLYFKAVGLSSL